ncbi:hypothetical protein [Vibrio crassostreae]|uniref:hypothetical protein n=1 Tax=Vibrio crassostreae TaxID=246167 RepID=UPI001B312B34|nr:hypothetical protein [Vibrio crassostreae]
MNLNANALIEAFKAIGWELNYSDGKEVIFLVEVPIQTEAAGNSVKSFGLSVSVDNAEQTAYIEATIENLCTCEKEFAGCVHISDDGVGVVGGKEEVLGALANDFAPLMHEHAQKAVETLVNNGINQRMVY